MPLQSETVSHIKSHGDDGYWYLATCFRSYYFGLESAYKHARDALAVIRGHEIRAYSPIAHWYRESLVIGLPPTDNGLWDAINRPLLRGAKGLLVVAVGQWRESEGIAAEIAEVNSLDRPVIYLGPHCFKSGR